MFTLRLPVRSRTGNSDPANNTLWTLLFQMALGCIMLSSIVWENTSAQNLYVGLKKKHVSAVFYAESEYMEIGVEEGWGKINTGKIASEYDEIEIF